MVSMATTGMAMIYWRVITRFVYESIAKEYIQIYVTQERGAPALHGNGRAVRVDNGQVDDRSCRSAHRESGQKISTSDHLQTAEMQTTY